MHLTVIFGIFTLAICNASNFNPDYPNITTCVVPEIRSNFINPSYAYAYLRNVIGLRKRCTHIYGNLHIAYIVRQHNGSDPDMSFLESIEEISGSLVLTGNSVKRIPLTNLRVIRGHSNGKEQHALQINNNYDKTNFLEEVDFRNLRVIMNKGIMISNNPGLVYLQERVKWDELLDDFSKQKITIVPHKTNATAKCHEDCDLWNHTRFCFGPSSQECQQRTKCMVNKESRWCNFTRGGELPCHHECAGGCVGKLSGDCAVCKNFFKNSKCTSTCAPPHNPVFGLDPHKDSGDKLIYTVGSLCSSQCPASLLDQSKICVFECNFDKHYKVENKCIECVSENCQTETGGHVVCDLAKIDPTYPKDERKYILNKNALTKLTDCTTILGALDIDDDSFNRFGVTVPLLYKHLSNVREIFGQLSLTFIDIRVENFTFLSNLTEVRRSIKSADMGAALKIYARNFSFLGFKSLKKVYGDVAIQSGVKGHVESKDCYMSKEIWKDISPDVFIKSECQKECHPLCTRGCWGPGNKLCYSCQFLKAGDDCVNQCSDTAGYYSHYQLPNNDSLSNTECRTCHPLCKQNCTGPSPKDCKGQCRFAMEGDTCVESCSNGYYPNRTGVAESKCLPCNDKCYLEQNLRKDKYACSGPLDILGKGGCSICEKRIRTSNGSVHCHKGSCPLGYFQSSIPPTENLENRIVHHTSCEPCHKLCKNCTNYGIHKSICLDCKGFFFDNKCVSVCPNEVKHVAEKVDIGGNCPRCHPECREGCQLANDSTKCHHCVNKKLFHDVKTNQFSCVPTCPLDRNYTELRHGDAVCLTYQETSYSRQIQMYIYFSIIFVTSILVLVLFFGLYCKRRSVQAKKHAEMKALYSNYMEPNMKHMKEDALTKPPNMRRLQMIPVSDLIFDPSSKPLGSGAFGKVFSGYWKVTGQDKHVHKLKVVIKIIHNSSRGSTEEFLEEAKIMASVSHKNCLPLIGVCLSLEKPCLISTFAEYGSLDKYLHQYGKKISSGSMLKWAEQIADGMAYLNKVNIIHRDLAARNVLVNDKNIVQITDFGLARLMDDSEESIVVKSGRVPIRWLSLETLLNATYSSATDVWAYGVTLWEIFTYGKRPYEDLETKDIKAYLQQGNRLCQPEISTLEVYMVMIKCWLDDPHMRPSFMELTAVFEQFSLTPRRYLYLPHEYESTKQKKSDMINLHQLSFDSDFKQMLSNNKSDETSWGVSTVPNDSGYNLIPNSYSKDQNEEKSLLPKRKKTKRNISIEKIKNISKFDLNKIIVYRNNRDSKASHYPTCNSYDGNKTTSTSVDSMALLVTQRSTDYDSQPINPQVAKIKKEMRQNSPLCDASHKIDNPFKVSERYFVDKNVAEESECLLGAQQRTVIDNKSPAIPPIEIPSIIPRSRPNIETKKHLNDKLIENSPDSDDYLIPSRISSAGYYNVTPSPSSKAKQPPHFSDSPLLVVHNKDYVDDGYLEPKKINQ